MGKLASTVRGIVSLVFTGLLIPLIAHFLKKVLEQTNVYKNPAEAADSVVGWFSSFIEIFWVQIALAFVAGLTVGLWSDWLLRRFDDTRQSKRVLLGYDMRNMADLIEGRASRMLAQWPDSISDRTADLVSLFINMQNAGLWIPENVMEKPKGDLFLINYLRMTGTLLANKHFEQLDGAQRAAKKQYETGPK